MEGLLAQVEEDADRVGVAAVFVASADHEIGPAVAVQVRGHHRVEVRV